MDLIELRNRIRDYTVRDDLSDSLINGFIVECEVGLRRDIPRHRLMEKTVEMTANVTLGAAVLPNDFKEARSVQFDGCPISLVSVDTRTKCKGTPKGYYLTADKLALVPPPLESGSKVSLVYYATIPALTDASPTNWVLDLFPTVYLQGVLARAYAWLKDSAAMSEAMSVYGNEIAAITEDHRRALWGGGTIIIPKGAGI